MKKTKTAKKATKKKTVKKPTKKGLNGAGMPLSTSVELSIERIASKLVNDGNLTASTFTKGKAKRTLSNVANPGYIKRIIDNFPTEIKKEMTLVRRSNLKKATALAGVRARKTKRKSKSVSVKSKKAPAMGVYQFLAGARKFNIKAKTQKEAEAKASLSEKIITEANNMFQLVLDTIPARIFWKDLNFKYLGCNRLV
ncbi:MAG: hypothetical protein HGA42_00525, partial [Nostocales cyanobacterium W4_Combined_metabat2_030]|nr:hypothetical protein [Nostocales cyanobacterium W4_Combined_metabat2_030]